MRLVYQEAFRSVGKALAREYVVKQLTRAQKDALVVSAETTPSLNQHRDGPLGQTSMNVRVTHSIAR